MPVLRGTFFAFSAGSYVMAGAVALVLFALLFKRRWLLKVLTYGYLLRFPLLNAAAMLGLVAAALFTGARSILGNLFDVPDALGVFFLSFTAFLNAWTVMLTWRLVVRHGVARFNLRSFIMNPFRVSRRVGPWQVVKFGWLALPVVAYAVVYTLKANEGEVGAVGLVLAALGGLALAVLLLWWIGRALRGRRGLAGRAARWFGVSQGVGRGYFFYRRGEPVTLKPGHGFATAMLGLALAFYLVVGFSKLYRLGAEPYFPTLGYVVLLLMVLCWGLSGAAFFFDRFRVPVLVPLFALFFVTAYPPWSDHYYAVMEARAAPVTECPRPTPPSEPCVWPTPAPSPATTPPPTPSPTPQPTPSPSPTPQPSPDQIIVVAANGGGIQASAWAAVVLTELQKAFGNEFGGKVRVVSSVSGGSVGAMYFVNGYEGGKPPADAGKLEEIVRQAEASSLDEVAWGLVFPDLMRAFTSFGVKGWDRGKALEYALLHEDRAAREAREKGGAAGVGVPLSAWAGEVAAGRPGSIFNATVSDTGQRIPLSTVEMPPCSVGEQTRRSLYDGLKRDGKQQDIAVVTAARLSATFPYVSPAARADLGAWMDEQPHLVDGGYYDNYGITSLVEWLDHELGKGGSTVGRVLVVEIHGAPTGGAKEEDVKRAGYDFATNRGWFYQFFAPLGTLLHVRDTGQLSNNRVQLQLLIDKWKGNSGGRPVRITDVVFECDLKHTPTSWHLTRKDKEAIGDSWKRISVDRAGQKSLTNPGECGLEIVDGFIKGRQ